MRPVVFLSTVVVVVFLGPLPTHGRTHAGLKEQIIQRIYSELEIEKERERESAKGSEKKRDYQRQIRSKYLLSQFTILRCFWMSLALLF